jgi:K+ transporter
MRAFNRSLKVAIIFIGIDISAVLNNLDNTFTENLLSLAIGTFSILLLNTYLRDSKQMVDEMQQSKINSPTSKNK